MAIALAKHHFLLLLLAFAGDLYMFGPSAFAQDRSPIPLNIPEKHLLPGSFELQITPRGMKYFENHLPQILQNLNVEFDRIHIPEFTSTFKHSYEVEDLQVPEATKQLVVATRNMLRQWFVGFPIKSLRPMVKIGNSNYQARFDRYALVPDRPLLAALGKSDGAVLALEMELKEISGQIKEVKITDTNNPNLGEFGLNKVQTKLADDGIPLRLRVPFYIRFDRMGRVQFETLEIKENITNINVKDDYKEIIAPSLQIVINGHAMALNKARLDSEVRKKLPSLLPKLQSFLSEMARKQLPQFLNEKAKQYLEEKLEKVNFMIPPGAAKTDDTIPFVWGVQAEKIDLKDSLQIKFQTFYEDPLNPKLTPDPTASARSAPLLNDLSPEDYDMATVLDRAIVNRILQLSYERKLFDKIPLGKSSPPEDPCMANMPKPNGDDGGNFLKFTRPPIVDTIAPARAPRPGPGEAFVKVHLFLQVPQGSVTGYKTVFLEDGFETAVDVILKLRPHPTGRGVQVVLWDIDMDTVWIRDDSISKLGYLISGYVTDQVKAKLKDMTAQWRREETSLPGALPLPPPILNIPLDILAIVGEPQGHLVLYLKYSEGKKETAAPSASQSQSQPGLANCPRN